MQWPKRPDGLLCLECTFLAQRGRRGAKSRVYLLLWDSKKLACSLSPSSSSSLPHLLPLARTGSRVLLGTCFRRRGVWPMVWCWAGALFSAYRDICCCSVACRRARAPSFRVLLANRGRFWCHKAEFFQELEGLVCDI